MKLIMENWRKYLLNETFKFNPINIFTVAFQPDTDPRDFNSGYRYDSPNGLLDTLKLAGYKFKTEDRFSQGTDDILLQNVGNSVDQIIAQNLNFLQWPSRQELTPTWLREVEDPSGEFNIGTTTTWARYHKEEQANYFRQIINNPIIHWGIFKLPNWNPACQAECDRVAESYYNYLKESFVQWYTEAQKVYPPGYELDPKKHGSPPLPRRRLIQIFETEVNRDKQPRVQDISIALQLDFEKILSEVKSLYPRIKWKG